MHIVIDNDLGADPDGLFALIHQLLCPTTDVRGIIGAAIPKEMGFGSDDNAAEACAKANEVCELLGVKDIPVVKGSNTSMPTPSDGSRLIISEALRSDAVGPLYVVVGGPLTNVAAALKERPEIAKRMTVVWIGGQEYDGVALPPPGYSTPEYNLKASIEGAKIVFNESDVSLWQIPRNAYRQTILPLSQVYANLSNKGKIGSYLRKSFSDLFEKFKGWGGNLGEVYYFGDSGLILLTALQTGYETDAASCKYTIRQAPTIADDGTYRYNPNGRNIRVYDMLDTRLLFDDMFAKFNLFDNR